VCNNNHTERRVIMIEIRKHPDVEAALYISGLGLKLPEDHSWIIVSERFSEDEIESSQDLASAFNTGLIEMRIDGDYSNAPGWYLNAYTRAVHIPVELLEDNDLAVVQALQNLKAAAHPIMWAIVRIGLFEAEKQGQDRSTVLDMLLL